MSEAVLCAALPLSDGSNQPPQWLHLLPHGEVRTQDGRGPYRVSDPRALIGASMASGKLVLDENHATDLAAPKGLPAPACGWIVQLAHRTDGIWGRVEWTEAAKRAETWRAYRGVSPVIIHRKDGAVLSIARASLTNTPNLQGLTSLHHRTAIMDKKEESELRSAIRVIIGRHWLDDKAKVLMISELLNDSEESAHAAAAEGHELALQAALYQKKMADAGYTVDFATAVRALHEGNPPH